jgi:outer membrane murein-binding lipoprotein Lpp
VVRAEAIAGLLLLAGCGDAGINQKLTDAQRDEVADIADDQLGSKVSSLDNRIAELEEKQRALEEQLGTVRSLALDTYGEHERLRTTFNHNVDLENKQKVAAMTARGACGQEWRQTSAGYAVLANKECTLRDLK